MNWDFIALLKTWFEGKPFLYLEQAQKRWVGYEFLSCSAPSLGTYLDMCPQTLWTCPSQFSLTSLKKENLQVTCKPKSSEMAYRWITRYIYIGEVSCLSAREGGIFPLLFQLFDQLEAEGMMAWWPLVDLHSDLPSSPPVVGHYQTGGFWLQRYF